MITNHIIMPIGIIKKSTGAGTTIRLIPPHPSADKLQPQMNILTRDSETGTHARAAVRVVEIQGNVAHLEILELETEPAWPEGRDPTVGAGVDYRQRLRGLPCHITLEGRSAKPGQSPSSWITCIPGPAVLLRAGPRTAGNGGGDPSLPGEDPPAKSLGRDLRPSPPRQPRWG